MKFHLTYLPVLFLCFTGFSQAIYLDIKGNDRFQTQIIDSLGYIKKHGNAKSIQSELNEFQKKIVSAGFLNIELLNFSKTNDSTFYYQYDLKNIFNQISIIIPSFYENMIPLDYKIEENHVLIPFTESGNFMNSILRKLEKSGFSMAEVKLIHIDILESKKTVHAELKIETGKSRKIDDIIINGFDYFPESHRKNMVRLYKKKVLNQKQIEHLHQSFQSFQFTKQFKYPEILFTEDSTKIYVYLEKASANRFDGFVGFANNENNKIRFNGYLDLMLQNALKGGEKLMLYWKSDGNEQTTINVSTELPYLFKSPFGMRASLNIFKQDSTFQNSKYNIDLGYLYNYQTKLYLGYQSTNSNEIQNLNNALISDFKSEFLTSTFEISKSWSQFLFFKEKYAFILKTGFGNRDRNLQKTPQQFASIYGFYNIIMNERNIIYLKTENYFLNSGNFLTNELYRFGGINSIRGFNENSLQANWASTINSEYRFMVSPNLYIHSIVDFGYFQDQTNNLKDRIYAFGFGFGLASENGIFNLNYANGNNGANEFKLSNSIVHISFKAQF